MARIAIMQFAQLHHLGEALGILEVGDSMLFEQIAKIDPHPCERCTCDQLCLTQWQRVDSQGQKIDYRAIRYWIGPKLPPLES